jgi:hypothetical protein
MTMRKALILLVCALVVPVVACADLTIKEETTVQGFMGIWTSKGSEITYIKGDKVRNETEVERSGAINPSPIKDPPPRIVIFRGDKDVMWRVNLKDKTYAENSLAAMEETQTEDVRFKIADLTLEPTTDVKELAGRECKGVKGSIIFEMNTGDEVLVQPVDLFFWMAEDTKGLDEMRAFWQYSVKLAQGIDQEVPLGDVFDKMWDEMEEFKGVPLGMEMTMEAVLEAEEKAQMQQAVKEMLEAKTGKKDAAATGNEIKMSRMVISISSDKLDDSIFEIPEGFKQASRVRLW